MKVDGTLLMVTFSGSSIFGSWATSVALISEGEPRRALGGGEAAGWFEPLVDN